MRSGARLGVYLDAACTIEVFTFDADDLIASETLVVPVERVWLKYESRMRVSTTWLMMCH